MNYIKHLNAVFQQFSLDSRLNPTHISLYMALFQYWNINRFPEEFYINREEIMKMSKIGSKATYHRCLKNLHSWKYIRYLPSHNPYKGSKIRLPKLDTSIEPSDGTTTEPTTEQLVGQALVSYKNINKHITNTNKVKLPKNKNEVLIFFEKRKWPELEAEKFFNHYNGIGWKIGGKIKITDWHSTAENWMLKFKEIETGKAVSQKRDNLKTSKIKNYGQPL
ncbi:hypothetical protein [Aequorivita antarctica]|uniref:Uncharacterized protein n=1 Tax=Aequorivita antarctica TaxID=153266 RepID=A0A5C6Z080_9FLAO|nr:hypothetical protein [Aequorivita antarctica]TXD72743.1 hypothetical protein ESU54_11005 [Aequorivita antarctica]SRX76368.1 hypothetical protein AEQU3_03368 [Aequorivita antarctica]